jgi:hypothetical protein
MILIIADRFTGMPPDSSLPGGASGTTAPPSQPHFLRRRLARAHPSEVVALRRRRRVARCLACLAGAAAFFALYVASWVLVLDL